LSWSGDPPPSAELARPKIASTQLLSPPRFDMPKLYTQLNFPGTCEEAFRFYEKHLGAKLAMLMRQNEAPGAPADATRAVIHARLEIAGTVLIGNDVPPSVFQKMRSAYLYLSLDSAAEAERAHKALAEGGEIFMPLEETFFASRFSMLRDRFGVSWSVIHERRA
jgi:PhnB protein